MKEEQSDSKAWAEDFITKYRDKAQIDSAQRKQSSEGTSAETKRTKVPASQPTNVTTKKSFAEIAKESYIRALSNRSSHDGAIPQTNCDLINRYKEIQGHPERKSRIRTQLELWLRARLDVVHREDIPNRRISRAWISDFHSDILI